MTIWASLPALVVPEVLAVVGDVAGVALGLVILIAGGTWELAEEVDRNICSDRIKGPSFGGERVELEGRSDDILSWVLERLQHELHGTRVASLVSAAVVNDELFSEKIVLQSIISESVPWMPWHLMLADPKIISLGRVSSICMFWS